MSKLLRTQGVTAPAGFRATSFRPAYGLAEATLAVSFPPLDAPLRCDTVAREALTASGEARPVEEGAPVQLDLAR